MTTVEIQTLPEAHVDRALDHADLVFHETAEEKRRKQYRDSLLRCERIGAYEGERLVGLAAAHPFQISVPGGELPAAGLTFVSVAPTHRRRGVLTGLIDEAARRCVANGQPLAALWASEAAIYGRFGFGSATGACTVEIDSTRPLALRLEPDDRPLRLVDPEEVPALLGPTHAAGRAVRAGRMARDEYWWREEILREEDDDDKELSPPRVVVLGGTADRPAGYVVYRTRGADEDTHSPGIVQVYELEADTPAVAASLWRYLTSIDLTGRVRAPSRPLDDPLLLLAADRDQVRVTAQAPALWLRLVDVAAALTARSWAAPVDVVLEVTDARLPANAGRFRLTAGPDGATYRPTSDAAELTVDVRDLGACYLGGGQLRHLVRTGLVTEHATGTAARLDAALHTDLLPHAIDDF